MTDVKVIVSAEDRASRNLGKAKRGVRDLRKETQSGAAAFKKYALGIAGITTGVAAARGALSVLKSGIEESLKIDRALTEVQTLLGETTADMDKMKNSLLNLGVASGQSMDALTKGLYDAVSAGVDFNQSLGFMKTAADLAQAGLVDISQAVDQLTSVMNAYGLEASQMSEVNDAIFTAVKGGKTTVGELSAAIGQLAPIAKSAGLSIDEMYASIATVTKGGISTRRAITGIRAALGALLAPGQEAADAMARLGLNISSQRIASEGLVPVLKELDEATQGNFEATQELVPVIEALPALLALASGGAEEFAEQMENMKNKSGAARLAVNQMSDDLTVKIDKLGAAWRRYKVQMVKDFEPAIAGVVDALKVHFDFLAGPQFEPGQRGEGSAAAQSLVDDTRDKIARAKAKKQFGLLDGLAEELTLRKDLLRTYIEIEEREKSTTATGIRKQVNAEIERAVELLGTWKKRVTEAGDAHVAALKKVDKEQKKFDAVAMKAAKDRFDFESKIFELRYNKAAPKAGAASGIEEAREALKAAKELSASFGGGKGPNVGFMSGRDKARQRAVKAELEAMHSLALAEAKAAEAEYEQITQRVEQRSIFETELRRREANVAKSTGEEKIRLLKDLIGFRTRFADEYVDQTYQIISAEQAHQQMMEEITRYQAQVDAEWNRLLDDRRLGLNAALADASSAEAKLREAEGAVKALNSQIQWMHDELDRGVVMFTTLNALDNVKRKIDDIDRLLSMPREMIIKAKVENSPKVPFDVGVERMREKLSSLPRQHEFVVKGGGGGTVANFTANITVGEGGGSGSSTAKEIDRTLASMWKTKRSELRQAMEN